MGDFTIGFDDDAAATGTDPLGVEVPAWFSMLVRKFIVVAGALKASGLSDNIYIFLTKIINWDKQKIKIKII